MSPATDTQATPAPPRRRARPGLALWTGRSDVEQVRLYTVASLHLVAWFLAGSGALGAAAALGATGPALVVVAVAVVVGLLAGRVTSLTTADVAHHATLTDLRWPLLGVGVVLVGLTAWGVVLDAEAGFTVVLLGIGAVGWVSGGLADSRLRAVAVGVTALAAYAVTGHVFAAVTAVVVAGFFAFTVVSSLWLLRIVTELDRARGTQAALAVAEERLRFSRDVHDVLGRHLATIAVQSELAATLARRGDERTGEKILEVRATAHDALREARELARGYRPLDLAHELDGAVSLLRSAGIAADADLDGLAPEWHEPVARVVREAVTNVLRHSDASRVVIAHADRVVSVVDDGTPRPAGFSGGDGSGLRALAEELGPLGARLEAGPHDDGFAVRLDLAGAAPRRTQAADRAGEPS